MNIRKAQISDSEGIAKVQVDAWQETYKGLINEEYMNSLSYSEQTEKWKKIIEADLNAYTLFVMENELKTIVGFVFGGANIEKQYKYDADLHAIYILKAYQNQGYGSKLIKMAINELTERGFNSLIIWALKDNSYSRFYEKLNGIKVEERLYTYGNQEVELIGYGWKDINFILK